MGNKMTWGDAASQELSKYMVQRRYLTITHADLTVAVNGDSQAINIGAALPSGARILGCDVLLATQFTGGSASAVRLDVGISGEISALINNFDAFGSTAGASAFYAAGSTAATRPRGSFSAAQLIATFDPDASHTLAGLTAGSCTIYVDYYVPGVWY